MKATVLLVSMFLFTPCARAQSDADWSPWVEPFYDGAYHDRRDPIGLAVRTRCSANPTGSKNSVWEIQLQNRDDSVPYGVGASVVFGVKYLSAAQAIQPMQILSLPSIASKGCSKSPEFEFDVWHVGNATGRHFKIHYKNGVVSAKSHIPTDWADVTSQITTGVVAGLGGAVQPPQTTQDKAGGSSLGASSTAPGAPGTSYAPPMKSIGRGDSSSSSALGQGSRYVDAVPQCARFEYRNTALFIVNLCMTDIFVNFTSSGSVWGAAHIAANDSNNTGSFSSDVNRAGGVVLFACPGYSTPVDPQGVPFGHDYKGEYRCNR